MASSPPASPPHQPLNYFVPADDGDMDVKVAPCYTCGIQFDTTSDLFEHLYHVHGWCNPPITSYDCKACKVAKFPTREELEAHIANCETIKLRREKYFRYKCEACKVAKFPFKFELEAHIANCETIKRSKDKNQEGGSSTADSKDKKGGSGGSSSK